MSKNVNVNGVHYPAVSHVQLNTTEGGTALFQDVDEIATPSGSVTITENGTHDVSAYAQAVVNVAAGESDADSYEDFVRALLGITDETELTDDVSFTVPEGITALRKNAFANMFKTTSAGVMHVTLPDSLQTINQNAFYYNVRIAIGELPKNLKYIGGSAFGYAYNIFGNSSVLKIPASVETIDALAFYQYQGTPTTVTFEGTPTTIASNAFQTNKITTINVPWAEGAVENAPWGATSATINYNYTGA